MASRGPMTEVTKGNNFGSFTIPSLCLANTPAEPSPPAINGCGLLAVLLVPLLPYFVDLYPLHTKKIKKKRKRREGKTWVHELRVKGP